ncbi:T9SS type A sorting domain-containing protein [Winogradskyella forsetii]|uniref:T9SS type A sorting domain-containing protein n=1 Tax=Winogradskyella forsetii TaxID=2686077 RepID=UPI0015B9DFA4|nr:T9SS type A sorting domain-containing protein [Winogradskyella forsetii]
MTKIILTFSVFSLAIFSSYAQGWGQIQKMVPLDRASNDSFGFSVAMDGDYAIVGARDDDFSSSLMGSAYIFKKDTNGNWMEHQKISASDKRQFDFFGNSVSISNNYMIIGARGQDYDQNGNNFENAAGAAYIFENDGNGNWNQTQKIVASDRGDTFQAVFGETVAISGNYAVVNAALEDTGLAGQPILNEAGACYIFERDSNGVWNEVQKIVSSDRDANERWGDLATAISGDTIAIGAKKESLDDSGENEILSSGAVYFFQCDTNGVWIEIQKIVASDREQGEWFGESLSIDGNTIVVGAGSEYLTGNTNTQYGAVYIFEKNDIGLWVETQKMRPSYLDHQSKFGHSVAIDNDNIIVRAYRMDIGSASDGGAAFIFNKDSFGVWNQVASVYDNDAIVSDEFGFSVAISDNYAIVGAHKEDEDEVNLNTLTSAGSAFIFNINEPNTLPPLNTLSILGSDLETSIVAFPNPNQGNFTINLGNTYKQITYSVTNSLGQEIQKYQVQSSNKLSLNIDSERGIYFVNVSTDEGKSTVLKIIKQ